jgi:hypothetical protein
MSACSNHCSDWVSVTQKDEEVVELAEGYGALCFCCSRLARYSVCRIRARMQESRNICIGCYVKPGLIW